MIDSHFHSNIMQQKGIKLTESTFEGLSFGLDIGTSPDDFQQRKNDLVRFPHFYMATGLFPGVAEEGDWTDKIQRLESVCEDERNIALGEIGLDYHWNYATPELQQQLFLDQIELANYLALPVLIHCRDAENDILKCLGQLPPTAGFLIHCFSGDETFAEKVLSIGGHISFAGNLTYPKSNNLHKAAVAIPENKLLTETDSPFLSPQIKRGKPNRPANVRYVTEFLSELRAVEIPIMENKIEKNFKTFFNIADE